MGIIQELLNSQPTTSSQLNVSPVYVPSSEEQAWRERHSGVQGVARDILGGLGDFLLTRLKMKPMYADSKRQHELNYASRGLDSPDQAVSDEALNRIQGIDYGLGMKARDMVTDNRRLAAAQANTQEARDARLTFQRNQELERQRNVLGNFVNGLATRPETERAKTYEQMLPKFIQNYPEAAKDLPDSYDPTLLDAYADSRVPVGAQRTLRLSKDKMDQQGDQFNTRNETTIRGQNLSHQDRQASISAANERAKNRDQNKPVKTVMSYTGDDGYRYAEQSDGTVLKSKTKVRPPASATSPVEGTRKVINGKTYIWKNGKAVLE